MSASQSDTANLLSKPAGRRISVLAGIVLLQFIAAAYFIIDGIDDLFEQTSHGLTLEIGMDWLVPFALVAGIIIGIRHIRHLSEELRQRDISLNIARGALAQQIAFRFGEWGLTAGEADVALFAMKGCNVAEIARLRNAATGTVRSQLSQIYAKAGVSSQSMLVSLFIEDLLDIKPSE